MKPSIAPAKMMTEKSQRDSTKSGTICLQRGKLYPFWKPRGWYTFLQKVTILLPAFPFSTPDADGLVVTFPISIGVSECSGAMEIVFSRSRCKANKRRAGRQTGKRTGRVAGAGRHGELQKVFDVVQCLLYLLPL